MTQVPENKNPEKKNHDNRWWEFYFVRYFVGTALGTIVILFLATADSPVFTSQGELAKILKTLMPVKFESGYIAVLATLGLTFCYIASAPILVLHAIRGSLLNVREIINWRLSIIFTLLVLIVSGVLGWTLWSALNVIINPWCSQEFYAGMAFLFLVSLIFVGQLFLLWMAMSGREQYSFEYYDQLVKKRADANPAGIEYVESYRHLREHGNAFFIALLELVLGAALFYSPVSWGIVVMLWILPAAGIWLFGTLLERRPF